VRLSSLPTRQAVGLPGPKKRGKRPALPPLKVFTKGAISLELVSDRELEGPGGVNTGNPVIIIIHSIGALIGAFSYREPFADRVKTIVDISITEQIIYIDKSTKRTKGEFELFFQVEINVGIILLSSCTIWFQHDPD
jgi:hypothetical protein